MTAEDEEFRRVLAMQQLGFRVVTPDESRYIQLSAADAFDHQLALPLGSVPVKPKPKGDL